MGYAARIPLTSHGETLPLAAWEQRTWLSRYLLYQRHIVRGWSPAATLETPYPASRRHQKRWPHIAHAIDASLDDHPEEKHSSTTAT